MERKKEGRREGRKERRKEREKKDGHGVPCPYERMTEGIERGER
jgi:hypothetical protein